MIKGSRQLDLSVPAETVWDALVAPGFRDWYYRLTPEGEFVEGGHIRWVDVAGGVAEESEVVRLEPPRRIELLTKYVFAPNVTSLPPHRMVWTALSNDTGCVVGLEWEAEDQVSAMLEAEGENMLLALRVAVDPKLQAELARVESIGTVEIRDVTPERLDDYLAFFDHEAFRDYPAWRACYCMETHLETEDDGTRKAEDNRRDMIELIKRGRVTALLAYAEEKPVGWCNYGETTALANVMRRFKLERSDYAGIGSISCFIIAAPYRRHGIASRLLDTALDRLRKRGLKSVEAYPVREDGSAQGNYRGAFSMYTKAGFQPYRDAGRNVIVRKAL